MKHIIFAMLLALAGCQWAAASTDDSTAAREIYNRYASRRGYTAKIKHSQGVSLVWITAKNDAKWKALKEELSPLGTDSLVSQALQLSGLPDTNSAAKVSSTSHSISMVDTAADSSAIGYVISAMLPAGARHILPEVKYDSAVAVTKTVVYENGKLKEEKTEVKTDEQLDDCRAKLLENELVKNAAKHVGTGHIMVANDDERTVCLCFYASGDDILSLVFLATALLGK